jgi:nucleoside-diphosphate-sugar epimerase
VPYVIEGLLGRERVAVTSGRQRRDYSYVGDHVRALILAATRPLVETGRVYNVGSGRPIQIRALIEAIADAVAPGAIGRVEFDAVPARHSDEWDMFADIAAARSDLGYEPVVALPEGLAVTVAWHRAARAKVLT